MFTTAITSTAPQPTNIKLLNQSILFPKKMNIATVVVTVVALIHLLFMSPATAQGTTASCVLFRGMARCVRENIRRALLPPPLRRPGVKMCPFRACGPSYVSALDCPTDGSLQTTAKCRVRQVTPRVWRCIETAGRISPAPVDTPLRCSGPECTGEMMLCECHKIRVPMTKYSHIADVTPICPR